jgi:hypothetical protein
LDIEHLHGGELPEHTTGVNPGARDTGILYWWEPGWGSSSFPNYVDQPELSRYSSARNYAGQEALIEVMRVW